MPLPSTTTVDSDLIRQNDIQIPFYANGAYSVILTDKRQTTVQDIEDNLHEFTAKAAKRFVQHYFPEFYPQLYLGPPLEQTVEFQKVYFEILDSIGLHSYRFSEIKFPTPGHGTTKLLFSTSLSFLDMRNSRFEFAYDGSTYLELPSFNVALAYFNKQQEVRGMADASVEALENAIKTSTTLDLVSIPMAQLDFHDTMSTFSQQIRGFEGAIDLDVDMGMLQSDVSMCMQTIVNRLLKNLEFMPRTGPAATANFREAEFQFTDVDYLTIHFGQAKGPFQPPPVMKIEYFLPDITDGLVKPMSIGFFTTIKYAPFFRDNLAIRTLQSYDAIAGGVDAFQNGPLGFLAAITGQTPQVDMNQLTSFAMPGLPPVDVGNFDAGNSWQVSDLAVDMSDTGVLKQSLGAIMTAAEMEGQMRKIKKNPQAVQALLNQQKAAVLGAGVAVAETAARMASGGFADPASYAPNNPGARKASRIMRQFGLDQLIKEVIMCFTFGIASTMTRIAGAVKEMMIERNLSIYQPPNVPRSLMEIPEELPFPDPKAYFTISGGLGNKILNIILNALTKMGFDMIMEIVRLLKERCPDLLARSGEPGEIDAGNVVLEFTNPNALAMPTDPRLRIAAKRGLTPGQSYNYLSDVSALLTPIDLCRLFISPADVRHEVMNNILEFNETYSVEAIRNNLNTRQAVASYFTAYAHYMDTNAFCESVIQNNVYAAIGDVCLTEGEILSAIDNQTLDRLIDILENGFQLEAPNIDFLCPENPDFLSNPLIIDTIPSLVNTIAGSLETQFAYAIDSVQSKLLTPELRALGDGMGMDIFLTLEALQQEPHGPIRESDMPNPNSSGPLIREINDQLAKIAAVGEDVQEFLETITGQCDLDLSRFGSPGAVMDIITQVLGLVAEILQNQEIGDAIQSLGDNLTQAGEQADMLGPMVQRLVFPEEVRTLMTTVIRSHPSFSITNGGHAVSVPGWGNVNSNYRMSYSTSPDHINFNVKTEPAETIRLRYFSFSQAFEQSQLGLDPQFASLKIPDMFFPAQGGFDPSTARPITIGDMSAAEAPLGDDSNPYINLFTHKVLSGSAANLDPLQLEPYASTLQTTIAEQFHPAAYMGLIKRSFDYIVNKGAYSTAAVQNLNLFKNNYICSPEDVGDMLDLEGILEQTKREFSQAACDDAGAIRKPKISLRDKVRQTIRLTLLSLFIQINIAEFVMKNIFAFTAFDFSDFLKMPGMKNVLVEYVNSSIEKTLGETAYGAVRGDIVRYFNQKIARGAVVAAGGIRYTDPNNNEIVFPAGSVFVNVGSTAVGYSFNDILSYLVTERLTFSWGEDQGVTRTTTQAIQNILQTNVNQTDLTNILIRDVIGFADHYLGTFNNTEQGGVNTVRAPVFNRTSILNSSQVTTSGVRTAIDSTDIDFGRLVFEKHIAWGSTSNIPAGTLPEANSAPVAFILNLIEAGDFGTNAQLHDVTYKYRLMYYVPTNFTTPGLYGLVENPPGEENDEEGDNPETQLVDDDDEPGVDWFTNLYSLLRQDVTYPESVQVNNLFLADETAYMDRVWSAHEFLKTKEFKGVPVTFEARGEDPESTTLFVSNYEELLENLGPIALYADILFLAEQRWASTALALVTKVDELITELYGTGDLFTKDPEDPQYDFLHTLFAETKMNTEAMTNNTPVSTDASPFVSRRYQAAPAAPLKQSLMFDGDPAAIMEYYIERGTDGGENERPTPFDVNWANVFAAEIVATTTGEFDPAGVNRKDYADSITLMPVELLNIDDPVVRYTTLSLMQTEVTTGDGSAMPAIARLRMYANRTRNSDINIISQNADFQKLFSQTFNAETLFLIPLLYNLHITDQYFPQIAESFAAVKNTTLRLYKDIMRGDGNAILYNTNVVRAGGDTAESLSPGEEFGLDLRDFVLKALKEFPLQILKAICELIDPHVALSKLIKNGSAAVFRKMEIAIDQTLEAGVDAWDEMEANLAEGENSASFPDSLRIPRNLSNAGLNGENILSLLFCFINVGIEKGVEGPPGIPGVAEAKESLQQAGASTATFGPRFAIDGIDFLGSFMGMFMLPPSPLGLLYLLFELLNNLPLPEDDDFSRPECAEIVEEPEAT